VHGNIDYDLSGAAVGGVDKCAEKAYISRRKFGGWQCRRLIRDPREMHTYTHSNTLKSKILPTSQMPRLYHHGYAIVSGYLHIYKYIIRSHPGSPRPPTIISTTLTTLRTRTKHTTTSHTSISIYPRQTPMNPTTPGPNSSHPTPLPLKIYSHSAQPYAPVPTDYPSASPRRTNTPSPPPSRFAASPRCPAPSNTYPPSP
jgi:hypothetical protein